MMELMKKKIKTKNIEKNKHSYDNKTHYSYFET